MTKNTTGQGGVPMRVLQDGEMLQLSALTPIMAWYENHPSRECRTRGTDTGNGAAQGPRPISEGR